MVQTKMSELEFLPQPKGVYYLDRGQFQKVNNMNDGEQDKNEEASFLIETICHAHDGFTKKDTQRAIDVWCLQGCSEIPVTMTLR